MIGPIATKVYVTNEWQITVPVGDNAFPLGPVVPTGVVDRWATFVLYPTPYFIAGFHPDEGEGVEGKLELARRALAAELRLACSPSTPKIGLVDVEETGEADLLFRTRKFRTQTDQEYGWHEGIPASGILALGVALTHPESIPSSLLATSGTSVRVLTPAGIKKIEFVLTADGRVGISLCAGPVTINPAVDGSSR